MLLESLDMQLACPDNNIQLAVCQRLAFVDSAIQINVEELQNRNQNSDSPKSLTHGICADFSWS